MPKVKFYVSVEIVAASLGFKTFVMLYKSYGRVYVWLLQTELVAFKSMIGAGDARK